MSRDLNRSVDHLRAVEATPRAGETTQEARLAQLATDIVAATRRFDRARTENGKINARIVLMALGQEAMGALDAHFAFVSKGNRQNLIRAVEYASAILKREP